MSRRACILGHPVAHSRSPMIHGYWLKAHGLDGHYGREDVTPEDLADFLLNLEGRGYVGANVTVPHKEAALALADADETARAVGAANTLWREDGRLCATNTDVHGFLANLDEGAPGWDSSRGTAVVLGAGGASRAVVFGLKQRGFSRVTLVNRTIDRACQLAAEFGDPVTAAGWSDLTDVLAPAQLLVNATSLGMTGKPPLEIAIDGLPRDAVATDLVYAPLETDLLARARARGNRVVDGLGMLLHQAVPGFEKWFGLRPEVTPELRALVVADLMAAKA
jgi:shikimate dehydrogenase